MYYNYFCEIYSKCDYEKNAGYMHSEEFMNTAGELIVKLNDSGFLKKAGFSSKKENFPKKMYKRILNKLDQLDASCLDGKGGFLKRDDAAAKKIFGHETFMPVGISMCLFSYFLISEMKLNKGSKLYSDIMESGGYNVNNMGNSCVEDYILRYILGTGQGLDTYIGLLDSWIGIQENPDINIDMEDGGLSAGFLQRDFTYNDLCEYVDRGYSNTENERKTIQSINQIDDYLSLAVNDSSRFGSTDILKVFDLDMIRRINNSKNRQRWYLLKMFSTIIKHQIEDVLDAYDAVRENKRNALTGFSTAIKRLWLEKGEKTGSITGTWSKLAQSRESILKYDEAVIETELGNSKVNIGGIAGDYDYYFDGSGYVLDYMVYNMEKVEQDLKGCAFASYEKRSKIYNTESQDEITAEITSKADETLREMIFGDRKISREMLLLTALLSVALGVDMTMDYITHHVLLNSRYPVTLSKVCCFDLYITETYDEIRRQRDRVDVVRVLKEKSTELEQEYMYEPMGDYNETCLDSVIAIFHEIIMGGKVV